ncbi:hypothetical protein [Sphaerotilus mobilis]|uniref:Tetratricopeptide repeat protein n=1 Tax=Sphaerotilus mobilis TaxID=47994 RepID=A0A4Q7LQZ2_9BURK|nr:hypothetical protein [Sphaerotilus mobilis]RZS56552.1 hypothetical protein EV685_1101 [Sphaerotilus mobilis]
MDDAQIASTLSELQRSSKTSLGMVLLGAACLIGALVYSATRLAPLEARLAEMDVKLAERQVLLEQADARLKQTVDSFELFQVGTRFLINRQYPEALAALEEYTQRFPDSSEAHGILGYAQLRQALFLTAEAKGAAPGAEVPRALAASEQHLRRAIELAQGRPDQVVRPWPAYNLSLLLMQTGRKEEALRNVTDLLKADPGMVRWLCGDGQFRPMRLDAALADRFVEQVEAAARSQSLSECWVTKAPVAKVKPKA